MLEPKGYCSVERLVGIAMVAFGTAVLLKWKDIKQLVPENMNVAPWLFIGLGSVVFVISIFGCCGAIRGSHCMVVTYAIFLIIIIIVEVALAVCMFKYTDSFKEKLKNSINKSFQDARNLHPNPFYQIERQFECCGKTGALDYGATSVATLHEECCPIGVIPCMSAKAHKIGCTDLVIQYYEKFLKIIAGVAIGVACVEVVGALLALCLANSIKNMDRSSRY